ncbi:MAG: hypothetical protein IKA10_08030 [Oscillospiraceae bacterium]|nr:hypothetical protein [Oscillospiraceae bacterium]
MKADFSIIKEKLAGKGKNYYFVIIGIIGIMLVASGETETRKKENAVQQDYFLYEYKIKTEKELTEFLENVEGVGKVKVIISLESGQENIYAQKEKAVNNIKKENSTDGYSDSSTYENEYIIIKNTGEEQALIEKTMQPAVQGVAVACSGADDISVVLAVTNSVSVVLDVPTHKICVTKMR